MAIAGTRTKIAKRRRRLAATAWVGIFILALAASFWGHKAWRAWQVHELLAVGSDGRIDPVRIGPRWMRTQWGDRAVTWLYAQPEWLFFDRTLHEEAWFHRLSAVPDLTHLDFRGGSFGDGGLQYLEPLTKLWWLHLDECRNITDAALPRIAKIKTLRGLSLSGTSVTDAGIPALEELRALEGLDLRDTAVSDVGLSHIGRISSLTSLCLGNSKSADHATNPITVRGLAELTALPSLRLVCLLNIEMTDEVVETLESLPALQAIWLWCPRATGEEIRRLPLLSKLTRLNAINGELGDEIVDSLLDISQLEHLVLDQTNVTDAGLSRLASIANLTWLSLNGTAITATGLAALAGHQKLTWLMLDDTQVGDGVVDAILAIPSLQYLHLARTAITDAGLLRLAKHPTLVRMEVSRTAVTPAGINTLLRTMPGLAQLLLDDLAITDGDLDSFVVSRTPLPMSLSFSLKRTGVTEGAAARLRDMVVPFNHTVDWEPKP